MEVPWPNPLHKLGYLLHWSLFVCRLCDRTLRPFPVGGPFPCQQHCASILPGLPTVRLAGEIAPFTRGRSIFLGCARGRRNHFLLPCNLVPHIPI